MEKRQDSRMEQWHFQSPREEGLHVVISPKTSDCTAITMLRLNLTAGQSWTLESGELEMNALMVAGAVQVEGAGLTATLHKLDSFYLPGKCKIVLKAEENTVCYIGAALCEGFGKPFVRRYQPDLPLGEIRQVHGEGAGRRDVFFTLEHECPASRLICGVTQGGDGAWTSWPPHQHERDLEEAYCYFDMDAPKLGFHLSYPLGGTPAGAMVHAVQTDSMVLAPRGYHPTVACPGTRNTYFWVLAAHSHTARRYDLAVTDPAYSDGGQEK